LGGGLWNLAAKTLQVFKSKQRGPWLVGEEGQGHHHPNSDEGWCRGGEELAHEHQELKARPGVGLEGRGGDRRWNAHDGRGGGEEGLVGEWFPGEEGGQVLV
jgi:hypothetical protein